MLLRGNVVLATTAVAVCVYILLKRRQSKHLDTEQKSSTPISRVEPAACRTVEAAFTVTSDDATLSALLCEKLPREFPSRAFCKQMLKRGQVRVDGAVAGRSEGDSVLCRGQRVEYVLPQKQKEHAARKAAPPSLKLEWAYVDDWLAVCVKPQGIATQGDPTAKLLNHAVAYALPPPNDRPDALSCAQHCHRIDKMTGGLLVYGRTRSALAHIGNAFTSHEGKEDVDAGTAQGEASSEASSGRAGGGVRKTYLAIVVGKLEGSGVIDSPIHGKPSRSRWHVLSCVRSAASGWVTTLRLHPETGRRHQLRRHLAEQLACPILGDPKCVRAARGGPAVGEGCATTTQTFPAPPSPHCTTRAPSARVPGHCLAVTSRSSHGIAAVSSAHGHACCVRLSSAALSPCRSRPLFRTGVPPPSSAGT